MKELSQRQPNIIYMFPDCCDFGYILDCNSVGTLVAVGARNWDGGSTDQGKVYIFVRKN